MQIIKITVVCQQALEECVDEGLIVYCIGVSNFNSQQIQEILDKARIKPAVLQVPFPITKLNFKDVKWYYIKNIK